MSISDGNRTLFLDDMVESIYVQAVRLVVRLRCKECP
jgi:hypothetical protein